MWSRAVDEVAVPAVAVFEVADAALAAGAPFDELTECRGAFVRPADDIGLPLRDITTLVTPKACSASSTAGSP